MAKIIFKDGSILETAKAFAPKDETGVIIFTNAHTADGEGIATMILEVFGKQQGANKIALECVFAFGDNVNNITVYGNARQETQQTQFPPTHQVTPKIVVTNFNPEPGDDGLPF